MATRKLALRAFALLGVCAGVSCGSGNSNPGAGSQPVFVAPTYAIGGTVTGLQGSGLVLQLNGSDDLVVSSAGTFAFPQQLHSGNTYSVTVKSQPTTARELCTASNASGTVVIGNVDSVAIQCSLLLGFVYTVSATNGNQIVTYGIDADTGALLAMGTAVSAGVSPVSLVVSPSGSTLYLIDFGSGTILSYSIDTATGALTAVGSAVAAGPRPVFMVVAPSGRFLYVADQSAQAINAFAIDPITGALSSSGAPLSIASYSPTGDTEFLITPDGKHLYMTNHCGPMCSPAVVAFNVDSSSGALTPGVALAVTGDVFHLAMDPAGQFLFVEEEDPAIPPGPQHVGSSVVTPYQINATTGALTSTGVSTTVPGSVQGLALSPVGDYAYTTDGYNASAQDDHVSAFLLLGSTHQLWSIGSDLPTYGLPGQVVADASGQFVFVANGAVAGANRSASAHWYDVVSYAVSDTAEAPGELTQVGLGTQVPGNQSGPGLIAVVE
ncbi:MAG: lactonase family protein [Steroidobacteraceae bacterium]